MKINKQELYKRAKMVKLLLLDVDGVLTSGLVNIMSDGTEFYTFNVYDGYGLKLCQRAGIKTGFITGRESLAVKHRAESLGVNYLFQNSGDKLEICEKIVKTESLSLQEVAFVGDDLQDLPILRNVGLAVTVSNGRKEVKKHAHYITKLKGGDGAVREVVELILRYKGLWHGITEQKRQLI